jgi:hypothetical protein
MGFKILKFLRQTLSLSSEQSPLAQRILYSLSHKKKAL